MIYAYPRLYKYRGIGTLLSCEAGYIQWHWYPEHQWPNGWAYYAHRQNIEEWAANLLRGPGKAGW